MHKNAAQAKKVRGLKAKILNKKRYSEKVQMKKTIKAHQEKKTKGNWTGLDVIVRIWMNFGLPADLLLSTGSGSY